MSFQCPKCGFRDSPCWRNSRFVLYAVYCTLDELQNFESELAAKLKDVRRLEEGPYVYYKRGKLNHIYRILKELEEFTKANKTEKVKHIFDANQRRLLEPIQP